MAMDVSKVYIACVVLEFIVIFFHCLGIYLLRCLIRNDRGGVQTIYIMNLSASEILCSTLYMIGYITNLIYATKKPGPEIFIFFNYLSILTETMVMFLYYSSMLFTVIDKFLEVFLNIKYPLYFNTRRASYIVAASWIIGVIFCVIVICIDKFTTYKYMNMTEIKFFFVGFDFLFIVVSIASYTYIFGKYIRTRLMPHAHTCCQTSVTSTRQLKSQSSTSSLTFTNLYQLFRGSRFYISALLILNFTLCTVIPDLVFFFHIDKMQYNDTKIYITVAMLIIYEISFLLDAWIYVFVQKNVRRILWKKLRYVRCLRRIVPSHLQGDVHVFKEPKRGTGPSVVSTTSNRTSTTIS